MLKYHVLLFDGLLVLCGSIKRTNNSFAKHAVYDHFRSATVEAYKYLLDIYILVFMFFNVFFRSFCVFVYRTLFNLILCHNQTQKDYNIGRNIN